MHYAELHAGRDFYSFKGRTAIIVPLASTCVEDIFLPLISDTRVIPSAASGNCRKLTWVCTVEPEGIRTHLRKADHYSGNVLTPLGQADCIRVSLCHYNSMDEVRAFLAAMARQG